MKKQTESEREAELKELKAIARHLAGKKFHNPKLEASKLFLKKAGLPKELQK